MNSFPSYRVASTPSFLCYTKRCVIVTCTVIESLFTFWATLTLSVANFCLFVTQCVAKHGFTRSVFCCWFFKNHQAPKTLARVKGRFSHASNLSIRIIFDIGASLGGVQSNVELNKYNPSRMVVLQQAQVRTAIQFHTNWIYIRQMRGTLPSCPSWKYSSFWVIPT